MSTKKAINIPLALRCEPDPAQPAAFQLVDEVGAVWAKAIPSKEAALVFGAASALLRGFEGLLEEAHECFRLRWNFEDYDPDFNEFVEDEGELEERFPGAPESAQWLQLQSAIYYELLAAVRSAQA